MEEKKESKLGLGIVIGLLIAAVVGLGTFIIYDKVISNDKKDNNKTNDKITCSDCVTKISEAGKYKILLDNKIRNVEYSTNYGEENGCFIKVDDKELRGWTCDGTELGTLHVINNKYLILEHFNLSFYDSNINKIDYVLDNENDYMYATGFTGNDSFRIENEKLIVEGAFNEPLDAWCGLIDEETYCECKQGDELYSTSTNRLDNKLTFAKYELTFENNKIISKRINGTEKYSSLCKK